MKIQCNVCEKAEAKVVCCADEAALCWACDEKVHAANKLASKHQRVPLTTSSSQIKCDICQEMAGYFFCLEDRALLCRKCDVAIHTANEYVSAHQRFLLTGAKVGLKSMEPNSSSSGSGESGTKISNSKCSSVSGSGTMPAAGEYTELLPGQVGGVGAFGEAKASFAGGSAPVGEAPWHLDEFFGLPDFNLNYGHLDHGPPSKGDSGKQGEFDGSQFSRPADDELDIDECFGQVPESSWTVPQIPSPPTASGLYWPKSSQFSEGAVFVPDIGCLPVQDPYDCQSNDTHLKRMRRF